MRKALVALCLLVSSPALADTFHISVTILDGEDVVDVLRYIPQNFDSKEACVAFLAKPDDRFLGGTKQVAEQAAALNYTLKIECSGDNGPHAKE